MKGFPIRALSCGASVAVQLDIGAAPLGVDLLVHVEEICFFVRPIAVNDGFGIGDCGKEFHVFSPEKLSPKKEKVSF
jgi:hypothetical protein